MFLPFLSFAKPQKRTFASFSFNPIILWSLPLLLPSRPSSLPLLLSSRPSSLSPSLPILTFASFWLHDLEAIAASFKVAAAAASFKTELSAAAASFKRELSAALAFFKTELSKPLTTDFDLCFLLVSRS